MNNTKFYNLNTSSFAIGSSGVTKIYLGSNLIYEQETKTITAMTLDNLVWVTNISWRGGTANSANCSYEVTAYYDDGTTGDVTSTVSVYGSQVVPKSYIEGAHSAGTLTLTPAFSGYTIGASTTIMQNSYNMRYHPLVFDIISGGTIMWRTFNDSASANSCTIEYKLNDADWSAITATYSGVTINVNAGDEIQFKGDNTRYGNSSTSAPWVGSSFCGSTATFDLHGNIMAMLNSDTTVYPSLNTLSSAAFCRFFGQTNVRNADGLYLPATTLANYCYNRLFFSCPNLISAPNLPATTVAGNCYENMFRGCTSLTTAPELPATTLTDYCYSYMFYGCTSLTTAPELPATNLAQACYRYMFQGCTSLTSAPELPATNLANYCYNCMFQVCTSLTTAPSILPATTLTDYCYSGMFQSCTSLTTAPELPATNLGYSCYQNMFRGCTSLTTAPVLPATTLTKYCYYQMFNGCTSLTTAPELPATTLADYCYYQMFTRCTNLNYIKCLATDISATNCTSNWVDGVQTASGTFVKNPDMNDWTTGNSGIPTGWTVIDAD